MTTQPTPKPKRDFRDRGRRIVLNAQPGTVHASIFEDDDGRLIQFELTVCGNSYTSHTWRLLPNETPITCLVCLGHVPEAEVEEWDGPSR